MSTCAGLGDYVDFVPCPYPAIVDAFNSIPSSDIPQPMMPQQYGCCNGSGLGSFTTDGTGLLGTGLFAGGLDTSTWGAGEFAVLAIGAYALYSMLVTTKRGVQRARVRGKKIKRGFTS
jgi:hypothetical protein